MDNLDINTILKRKNIETKIVDILNNFDNNPFEKKGIFIKGEKGIGKTQFIVNLLKKNNYDIINYDNTIIRNKSLIDNISSNNISNYNVCSMFSENVKKIAIIFDDIDSMNHGDKSAISSLIKLIRKKKTKKQKLENKTTNPIICINNVSNDKKILELEKVCEVFKLDSPTNDELLEIINKILPNLFIYETNINNIIKNNILNFLNNNLIGFNKLIFYYKIDFIKKIFYTNYTSFSITNNNSIKNNVKKFLEKNYDLNNNFILENERTTLSLLYHENVIQLFTNNLNEYIKILDNFTFSDYIDRLIFQKQIWQLNDINYIIKIFYNNFLLKKFDLYKNIDIDKIIFTKILTKYSSEYNNYIFIYNLLQTFLIEKKDLFLIYKEELLFNEEKINNLIETYNLNFNKVELIRLLKLIHNNINYANNINHNNIDYSYNIENTDEVYLI
jgi:hypothetical protein